MALFGGSESFSSTTNNITDERIVATDQGSVIRAEDGSSINLGLTDLSGLFGFATDALAGERDLVAASLASTQEALGGSASSRAATDQILTVVLIIGAALVAVQLGPQILKALS